MMCRSSAASFWRSTRSCSAPARRCSGTGPAHHAAADRIGQLFQRHASPCIRDRRQADLRHHRRGGVRSQGRPPGQARARIIDWHLAHRHPRSGALRQPRANRVPCRPTRQAERSGLSLPMCRRAIHCNSLPGQTVPGPPVEDVTSTGSALCAVCKPMHMLSSLSNIRNFRGAAFFRRRVVA